MRSYAMVGELWLSDGTSYVRSTTYNAPDMEAALHRAAAMVRQWRGERIVTNPTATVRGVIEVQISEDRAPP